MSKQEKSRKLPEIYHSVKVYHKNENDWYQLKLLEVGDLKHSVQNIDHNGWLKCDGRAVSREFYSTLFDIIGTNFGVGDGSNTFNLPDTRGRVLGSIGTGTGLSSRTLGQNVGSETHTLTIGEMPSHTHGVNDPGHTHTYINNTNDQNTDNAFGTETAADDADLNKTTGSSTTGITIQNAGGGGAHNNMQPTTFIGNVFIFANYL
jgi:microcystin-dependent protein